MRLEVTPTIPNLTTCFFQAKEMPYSNHTTASEKTPAVSCEKYELYRPLDYLVVLLKAGRAIVRKITN